MSVRGGVVLPRAGLAATRWMPTLILWPKEYWSRVIWTGSELTALDRPSL